MFLHPLLGAAMTPEAAYARAYKQFPALAESERRAWAERVAHNPHLQAMYFTAGPRSEWDYLGGDPRPFERMDDLGGGV